MANEINKIMLFLAIIIAILFGFGAKKNVDVLTEKIKAQQASTDAFLRWKAAYEALLPIKKQWALKYKSTAEIKDVYSIYNIIDFSSFGLSSDADKLFIERVDKIPSDSQNIGMNAVCLGNSNAVGVQVFSEDYDHLVSGLQKLSKRQDFKFTSIIIDGKENKTDKDKPALAKALLVGMCLLVRDVDTF